MATTQILIVLPLSCRARIHGMEAIAVSGECVNAISTFFPLLPSMSSHMKMRDPIARPLIAGLSINAHLRPVRSNDS